jgi:uncharacterized protein (TIGR02147 family)
MTITDKATDVHVRPSIASYQDPVTFLSDMLKYLKSIDPKFSILQSTKELRRVSPTLVSLILIRKRKLSLDRIEEISKLLRLNSYEKYYLKEIVSKNDSCNDSLVDLDKLKNQVENRRKEVSVHLLNDWINVYVKDCFQFTEFQNRPELVISQLSILAKPSRIKRSIQFLLEQGYLRRQLDGKIVVESNLTITESPTPSKKIRMFHRKALKHAEKALELFPVQERLANTFLMPLNLHQYQELLELIKEFNDKTMAIADQDKTDDARLYQLIINLSPVGAKLK